jgi:methylphosphotriester-DNA--protein-cysteine methyltransferase
MANGMSMSASQLQSAFKAALATNPKLRFGQFVAATTIAQNLAMSNPNITTNAILQGLASGKNLSQTLQGLGLSATQAKTALKTAHGEIEDERE